MDEAVAAVLERVEPGAGNRVVALAGGVAAGKTTFAGHVVRAARRRQIEAVTFPTDGFLLPNSVLAQRGLTLRKGFPDSYDDDGLAAAVATLRQGDAATIGVYDHAVYDVSGTTRVGPADLVVVEGVNALSSAALRRQSDLRVFLDADEAALRTWFRDRLLALLADPEPGSFYAAFSGSSAAELEAFADSAWDAVNGPNLRDHIGPSRRHAHLVVRLGPDHEVLDIVGSPVRRV